MSHEIGKGEPQRFVPSVTPEGAFSGGEMAHFTDCVFDLVYTSLQDRLRKTWTEVDEAAVYERDEGPIVVLRRRDDGMTDIACWGTENCPGATATVNSSDFSTLGMTETALAFHQLCKSTTRKYVWRGEVMDVPYSPIES